MNRMHVYLLVAVLAVPLPVSALRFLMHTRNSFQPDVGGGTDYTDDANCVGAWLMTGNNTNETDVSGDGNELVIVSALNDLIPTTNSVPDGYSGTSRNWDDDDGFGAKRLSRSDATISAGLEGIGGSTGHFSVIVWVFPDEIGANTYLAQFANTGDRSWSLGSESSGKLKLSLSTDGSSDTDIETGAGVLSLSTWQHVASIWDGVNVILYVDASPVLTNAFAGTLHDSSGAFTIGAMFNGNEGADALMDESAVFNRVLTPSEINDIYTDGIDGTNGGND